MRQDIRGRKAAASAAAFMCDFMCDFMCVCATKALKTFVASRSQRPNLMLQMELTDVGIDTHSGLSVVILRNRQEEASLPIWVGMHEGVLISKLLSKKSATRPLSHDLLLEAIRQMNYRVDKVEVTHSKNRLYYATIFLSAGEGDQRSAPVELDARPSDAFALALAADVPIYVADDLLVKERKEGSPVLDMTPPPEFRDFIQNIKASDFSRLGIRADLPEDDEPSS